MHDFLASPRTLRCAVEAQVTMAARVGFLLRNTSFVLRNTSYLPVRCLLCQDVHEDRRSHPSVEALGFARH